MNFNLSIIILWGIIYKNLNNHNTSNISKYNYLYLDIIVGKTIN